MRLDVRRPLFFAFRHKGAPFSLKSKDAARPTRRHSMGEREWLARGLERPGRQQRHLQMLREAGGRWDRR